MKAVSTFHNYLIDQAKLRSTTAGAYSNKLQRLHEQCYLLPTPDCVWLKDQPAMGRVMAFIKDHKHDCRIMYCCTLKHVIDMVDPSLQDEDLKKIKATITAIMKSSNDMKHSADKQQLLAGMEQDRWKGAVHLERNLKALTELSTRRPNDFLTHLRFLLYAICLGMKDICVFRLDLVYKTVIGFKGDTADATNHVTLGKTGEPATFTFTDYKTSSKYGENIIEAPMDVTATLEDSFRRFPRRFLFPQRSDYNSPMTHTNASSFVRSAWILTKEKGPSADDIRSALTTRFYLLNTAIIPRERFARKSMTSPFVLEKNYYKIHESAIKSIAFD